MDVAVTELRAHLSEWLERARAGAIHLASALAIGDPGLIVAVWDRRLHAGAQAAGCRVAPAELEQ
jgi:uncharacterized protein